nr:HAMP domain-containing sensor histidine kinase [Thiospirochaeta perfilievii]
MVDMAAHDLKSPLTLISGYANRIVKNTPEDSLERTNADKIVNSSNKMLSIINKLLNNSKYENQILNYEKLNIVDLINCTIKFYSDMAQNKKQKINFYYYSPEIFINVDKVSICTVLDNLLTNAIKYSPTNSHININLEDNGVSVKISIKDSGDGFTEKEIENLFTKFFPFKNKPTQGENSTGLGLYIIYDMVKKNNGKIDLKSKIGNGSEFILTFPKE